MKRVRFIEHKWRQILLLDFSYCSPDEALSTMDEARKIIRSQPEATLLILTDVTEGKYNMDVIESLKEFTKGNTPMSGQVLSLASTVSRRLFTT
jgi:hypothetical protein